MSFAIRVVRCYKYLVEEKHEFTLSKQMLRCGTSIGANIKEALRGQSRPDFIAKMNISLKEASECEYWIELLTNTEYLPQDSAQSLPGRLSGINKNLNLNRKVSEREITMNYEL
jgi:four helix bundle protein